MGSSASGVGGIGGIGGVASMQGTPGFSLTNPNNINLIQGARSVAPVGSTNVSPQQTYPTNQQMPNQQQSSQPQQDNVLSQLGITPSLLGGSFSPISSLVGSSGQLK